MASILDDIKFRLKQPGNALMKLIIINVAVFVLINLLKVFLIMGGQKSAYVAIQQFLFIPASFQDFIYQPWTLITYFFTHESFFHILFNMYVFYLFGVLIMEYMGPRRLTGLYFLGGIAGGAFYLLLSNLVPFFIERQPVLGMLGASASVYAVIVAAATMLPDYRFNLLLIGPVKIKYIAAVLIFLSFVGTVQHNPGGNVAHLGGALMGYLFVRELQQGRDPGKPVNQALDWLEQNIVPAFQWIADQFKPRPKVHVSYRNTESKAKASAKKTKTTAGKTEEAAPDQDEIDKILDKISKSGYQSLSKEEKRKLFKFGNNN